MPASERGTGRTGASGCVFNIQHYSVHDGPGIRTIVFLKGCPLRCRWCCNPESQQGAPELAFNPAKCIGNGECGRCVTRCERSALVVGGNGKVAVDRRHCDGCFKCVDCCPARALHVFGSLMTVGDVLKSVDRDGPFYSRSGGGLTVSGGEPLLQADFVVELLEGAKQRRIGTAMETCGHAEWSRLEKVCRHLDTLIYDIKTVDTVKHRAFTGVGNERIVANLHAAQKTFPKLRIEVRTPLIPGFNDSEKDISAIIRLLRGFPTASYEILPYHRMGQSKYPILGRQDAMAEARLDDGTLQALRDYARRLRGTVSAG